MSSNLVDAVKLSQKKCKVPIHCELKYASKENFVGRTIDGYHVEAAAVCLLAKKPAVQLCKVQNYLVENHNYGLLVLDAYRPYRAVVDFLSWSKQTNTDALELKRKEKHYPTIEKAQLFELGFLSENSKHCYGYAVDAVLVDLTDQSLLDMGTGFDFMHEHSSIAATNQEIGEAAYRYRQVLLAAMREGGFEPYEKEYWHFNYSDASLLQGAKPLDIPIKDFFSKN